MQEKGQCAMSLPFVSLDAATATGPGVERDLEDSLSTHTIAVTVTGSPSTVLVNLQGSHDGANWFSLGNAVSGTGVATRTTDLVRYVRAQLATLTGGTAPTVTATIASK